MSMMRSSIRHPVQTPAPFIMVCLLPSYQYREPVRGRLGVAEVSRGIVSRLGWSTGPRIPPSPPHVPLVSPPLHMCHDVFFSPTHFTRLFISATATRLLWVDLVLSCLHISQRKTTTASMMGRVSEPVAPGRRQASIPQYDSLSDPAMARYWSRKFGWTVVRGHSGTVGSGVRSLTVYYYSNHRARVELWWGGVSVCGGEHPTMSSSTRSNRLAAPPPFPALSCPKASTPTVVGSARPALQHPPPAAGDVEYVIEVRTADQSGAGSRESEKTIELHGANGSVGPVVLGSAKAAPMQADSSIRRGLFQRGKLDMFVLRAAAVGKLQRVKLTNRSKLKRDARRHT